MTWFTRLLLLPALLAPLLPAAGHAAEFTPAQRAEIVTIMRDALKQDPSILRDAVNALQADEAKRQVADQRAMIASHRDALVTPADPVAGNPHGDVTIVEFFDTRCPYCRRLEPVMEQFLAEDHGVKLVFKDLPILGDASVLGSKALLAAQKQGAYEKLREAIMQLPANTTLPMIEEAAKKLGLDWQRLERDMNDPSIQQRIDANTKLARTLDIQGTPALIIGQALVPGAVDVAELRKMVGTARKGG